jgi:hypothetical protein
MFYFLPITTFFKLYITGRSGRLLRLGFNEINQISVKKRSFSRPVSLFKSVFFSPIIIPFLQYSHKRSSHVPEIWPNTGFDVQYFIPNSLIASFLRSLCSTFVLWKVGEHAVVGKETLKFGSIFGSLPDFPSLRP